ncbi:unnamed protein product [Somion occarium]|uniref:Glycoside hydrolase family 76 protein n=1 Tax=Somion occarium TaxID=3059160 RepID=A0ABP1CWG7_9APHY
MLVLLLGLLLSIFPTLLFAEDFSIPSAWRKPTSDRTFSERANISQAVIDSIVLLFNASTGQLDVHTIRQLVMCHCASRLHRRKQGERSCCRQSSRDRLPASSRILPASKLNTDPLNWALAAIYAYRAYGEAYLLNIAQSVWDQTNVYAITKSQAFDGLHPMKNVTFPGKCGDSSVAGGVFYIVDNLQNTDVNGATVGGFMALSAHLYEATKDEKYATAAEASAEFIRTFMYNGTIIIDTITLATCAVSTLPVTYNSGFFIEGVSVLADVTQNTTWNLFLNQLIADTIKFPIWTGSDGILIERAGEPKDALTNSFGKALKGIFIRGLYEAWTRAPSNSDVATLIRRFIVVQYNALLDLASAPGSNLYSPRLHGPPVDHLLPWGQLAALDILNSAMSFAPRSQDNTTSSSPPPSTDSDSHKSVNKGLIVGVTIGAIALVAIIAAIAFFLWRRRKRSEYQSTYGRAILDPPEPFDVSQPVDMSQVLPPTTSSSAPRNPSSEPLLLPTISSTNTMTPPSEKRGAPFVLTYTPRVSSTSRDENASSDQGSSRPSAPSTRVTADDNPDSIPELVQRLNRAMANLPPGGRGTSVTEEEPPQYEPTS